MQNNVIGYIYETTDYSAFRSLCGNRFVDHSDMIVDSIKSVGLLMSPVTVNEKYEIIDVKTLDLNLKALMADLKP